MVDSSQAKPKNATLNEVLDFVLSQTERLARNVENETDEMEESGRANSTRFCTLADALDALKKAQAELKEIDRIALNSFLSAETRWKRPKQRTQRPAWSSDISLSLEWLVQGLGRVPDNALVLPLHRAQSEIGSIDWK